MGKKCQGLLQKEVYIATQEAADFSKRNKFLKKAIDKGQLKCDAEYEKLVKKWLEVRALEIENSQLQKLKSNFDNSHPLCFQESFSMCVEATIVIPLHYVLYEVIVDTLYQRGINEYAIGVCSRYKK